MLPNRLFRRVMGCAAAATLLFAAAVACGDAEEDVQDAPSASATAGDTAAPAVSASPTEPTPPTQTPIPTTTASPTSAPTPPPQEFTTYSHPVTGGSPAFSFAYPAGWDITVFEPPAGSFGLSIVLFSFDHLAWSSPEFPPDSMKVDIGVAPAELLSACGQTEAETVTLDGVTASRSVSEDPSKAKGVTRSIDIRAVRDGHCFSLTAYFAQEVPDEQTFGKIVDSFRFGTL